ncbi:MAG: hypothetical protein WCY43_00720 [Patescibacteria group bacterium]|nr:hypothetical protein [Patescibacteria group bacterium]
MIASFFTRTKSSQKVEVKSINSVVVINSKNEPVQIGYQLVKPKPKTFFQNLMFKKNNELRSVVFVGNQQTAQTRAANKHYYERALKLREGEVYRVKKILYNSDLEKLEKEERETVFSLN